MHEHVTCKNLKTSWVKPNPNLLAHIPLIKHPSIMHETLLKCNKNAMHEHITSNQQHPNNFTKISKTPKFFKNPKT